MARDRSRGTLSYSSPESRRLVMAKAFVGMVALIALVWFSDFPGPLTAARLVALVIAL
jgi:hypothetical protein